MSLNPLFQRSYVHQAGSSAGRRHRASLERASLETLETRQLLSLAPAGSYAAFSSPSAIAAADFNGDGKLDLATTVGIGNPRVSVRLGNGAGGFGAAQEFAFAFDSPSSIAVADFNNDNRLDLVVADSMNFSVLLGNGDGSFQPSVMTQTGDFPKVVVGHFNNDANLDLVVGWYHWEFGLHYQAYLGNGQGGFAAGPANQIGSANWGYDTLAAVELNQDGKLDVVIGDGRVLLGNGNGTFQYEYGQPVPLRGGAIATGDFTGDGNADVIISGNSIAVLRSRGDGSLDAPVHSLMNGAYGAVATTDFNVDGKLDAIAVDANVSGVSVMLGNGDGTLRFAGAFATGTTPSGVAVGDFNRDGRPDVAVANRDSSNVSVLLNDGDWTVLPPPPPPPPALSVSDVTVTEGNAGTRNATFTVSLSKPSAVDVAVSYGTQNGTAISTEDFDPSAGRVTIPAGQTSATFNIAVRGDWITEPNETFAVTLNSPTNATIMDGQGVCTIVNDDVLPVISINSVSKAEGKSGTTAITFTVGLSSASGRSVTVNYATANGTARAGTDYTSKSGTLTFAPGETVMTITVPVKGDSTKEADETFFVDLFGASDNALIGVARGTGTILDDDNILRPSTRRGKSKGTFMLCLDPPLIAPEAAGWRSYYS
jgi:hypothetical protein